MKFSLKNHFLLIIVLCSALALFLFNGCEEIDPLTGSNTKNLPDQLKDSFTVGPEGGNFNAISGNVRFHFPENALTEPATFTISEGPEDYDKVFVIKSIEIEPKSLIFQQPVFLSLRYDSKLCIGKDPCKAKCLVLYHFKNEMAFDKRKPADMTWISKCNINTMDQCIEAEITSGGIWVIGEASLGTQEQENNRS